MLDSFKDAFGKLPPDLQVWLTRLGTAASVAFADALFDALKSGQVAPTKESVLHVLGIALLAGWGAGRLFAAESPMPRRVWTWAERQAEAARIAAQKK